MNILKKIMSPDEAYKIFRREYPDLIILNCCLYDNQYYIFSATEDLNAVNYDNTCYAVNVNDKKIYGFYPSTDIDKYYAMLAKHTVPWEYPKY